MTTPKNEVFVVGDHVRVKGMIRNWTPVIVALDVKPNGSGTATVKTEGLPGSERIFKLHDLEKIK